MAKIRVLPEILVNKIAAGEIVERPASAVKELVENALDAGAQRVDVEADAGGRTRLTVRDDGEGMSRNDALLAFEHHATSKISTDEDLQRISTLGFRGEALPSIAAVSKVLLKTMEFAATGRSGAVGTQIEIQGGVIKGVRDLSWARGTEVTVRDLFYNIPARRKFLKTEATEAAHIARLVTHYTLARPQFYFTLSHNGRATIDAPPVKTLLDRALQIFSRDFMEEMITFDAADGALRFHGAISAPHRRRSSTDAQYFFINGRMVRDRVLSGALAQVYRGVVPAGAYPAAILFVEIPPAEIDVNVHPAKTEVRFRQSWPVQDFLRRTMEAALRDARPYARYPLTVTETATSSVGAKPQPGTDGPDQAAMVPGEPATVPGIDPDALRDRVAQRVEDYYLHHGERTKQREWQQTLPLPAGEAEVHQPPADVTAKARAIPQGASATAAPWRVLGQWRESFIVAASREELVVVDQHVAHERVLYEEYLRQLAGGKVFKQKLLSPVSIELTPAQVMVVEKLSAQLASSGFELEPFGSRAILIKAVPALALGEEADRLLSAVLERLDDDPATFSTDEIHRRLAAGLACRAAVKINTPLSHEKMQYMLDRLHATADPTTCPHGRPVVLTISIRDLEKHFKR